MLLRGSTGGSIGSRYWAPGQAGQALGGCGRRVFLLTFQSNRENARKATQYQAWQTINSAAGLPGDGGRSVALQDLNAADVSLAGVNLTFATLPGLTLHRACMQRTLLSSATLRAANLSGSDLSGAEIDGVDLTDADLSYSILKLSTGASGVPGRAPVSTRVPAPATPVSTEPRKPTTFQRTNMQYAILVNAGLGGIVAAGADMRRSNLGGANLERVVLQGANLREANLEGANLRDAQVKFADLRGTRGLTCQQLQTARDWDASFRGSSAWLR